MLQETRPVAERVLSEAWGVTVELAREEGLGGSNRSHVYRYAVRSESPDVPESVIVKRAATVGSESYEPDAPHGPAWRLFNDWAGLQFLTELAGPSSPAPKYYGGNRNVGLIVLEDLESGAQLDQLLLGEDRTAAVDGLMALMTALGRMHAMTIGRREAFDKVRDSLGPRQARPEPDRAVAEQKRKLREFTEAAGVSDRSGLTADFEALELFLDEEGPFMAYSHRDPCPDNCLVVGSEMRLLDFEFGDYRHALLDGVYGRMHFPSCWCVNRLPVPVYGQMEQVYRHELAKGCPEAADIELFERAVVEASAWLLLPTLSPALLKEDARWGISTTRQRALVRLDRFAEASAAVGHLELLGATARDLATALRQQWPSEADEMPLYPAFR